MKIDEIISRILPEGKYKEGLRRIFYNYHNPLYQLNEMIEQIELCRDGMLFIKLNNGFKCYGIPELGERSRLKYGNPQKMNKLIKHRNFSSLYSRLSDQFIEDIYEMKFLKKGNVVIDAGAGYGVQTIVASKKVRNNGRVIAIEPSEDNLLCLNKNIELNKLKNVTVIQKGLWSKKDKLKFYLKPSPESHSLVTRKNDVIKTIEIEVDTLDNILKDLKIDKVDFIKMDIEGAEIKALKGMKETLRSNNIKMSIASYHIVDGQPTYKTIIPMMKKIGFDSYFKDGILYFGGNE